MELTSLLEIGTWLLKHVNRRKILLAVEDNLSDKELLENELRSLKVKYDFADTAEKAEGLLENIRYAWALIDIGLPHKDGGTLSQEIRDKYPHTKVWLVTGNSFVNLIPGEEMRIVRKPITASVLREMII